jgi:hypothetical protein
VVVRKMRGIAREEAGYEKLERQQFGALERETSIVMRSLAIIGFVTNPIGELLDWLFGRSKEEKDDEPAPDYSLAEVITDENGPLPLPVEERTVDERL